MKKPFTFTFVKPHALENTNAIMTMILQAGYQIIAGKRHHFTKEEAERFYGVHKAKPFFGQIVEALVSGPVFIMMLTKSDLSHEDLVREYREFIGNTNPAKAEPGTIREAFGEKRLGPNNAVHASDSVENVFVESARCYPDALIELLAA